MKITFHKFGPIRRCELTLSDLVIVTGNNNSGKTYITHGVFGLLEQWRNLIVLPKLSDLASQLASTGGATLDLKLFSGESFQRQILSIGIAFQGELARTLASEPKRFEGTKVDLQIIEQSMADLEISTERKLRQSQILMVKSRGELVAEFSLVTNSETESGSASARVFFLTRLLREMILDNVFARYFPRVFIASSERTGAALFQGDLNPERGEPSSEDVGGEESSEPNEPDSVPAYPLSIQQSIRFLSSTNLQSVQRQTGVLVADRPDIIEALNIIINGSFNVTSEGIFFIPKGDGTPNLRLSESSSSVRSLLDVAYYIRHVLRPGDCFIIDEPELNLHPRNQRLVARLIGRLVNAGVKVFITTHSDYIIRELNTLILLAGRTTTREQLLNSLAYDGRELVDAQSVRFYRTPDHVNEDVQESAVHAEKGIEVASFDEVIEDLNRIQDSIIYTPEAVSEQDGENP